jgi:hypothetical protein
MSLLIRDLPPEKRQSFLERRNAKVVAPWQAVIEYGFPAQFILKLTRHPSSMYDYYYLFCALSKEPKLLLGMSIPKIPEKNNPGYFDLFGEKILCEKIRKH